MTPTALFPLVTSFHPDWHRKWLIADRDGTLNEDVGYPHKVSDLRLLPGVVDSLAQFCSFGWGLAIATNQSGLARGYFTLHEMEEFHNALIDELSGWGIHVSAIAICPHHPHGSVRRWRAECSCRKPRPGLLNALSSLCGMSAENTLFVGDSETDQAAATAASVEFAWARSERDWRTLTRTFLPRP